MTCMGMKEKLSSYIDGSLPTDEKASIEEHIVSCVECRQYLSGLENTVRALRELEEVNPPPWMTGKIMARLRDENKESIFRRLFYPLHIKIPLEAAAIFMVSITAVYLFRAGERDMRPVMPLPLLPSAPVTEKSDSHAARHESSPEPPAIAKKNAERRPVPDKNMFDESRKEKSLPVETKIAPSPLIEAETEKREPSAQEAVQNIGKTEAPVDKMRDFRNIPEAPGRISSFSSVPAAPALAGKMLQKEAERSLSLRVNDIDAAFAHLKKTVTQSGGTVVSIEDREGGKQVRTVIPRKQLESFINEIEKEGEVTGKNDILSAILPEDQSIPLSIFLFRSK